jgi:capsular exopolysaccharide synthesis family protein
MDVGRALAAVRRRWFLLLVVTIFGISTGVANFLLTPKSYTSVSTVLFSLNRGGSLSELADGNNYIQDLVPSYAKVAEMPIVLDEVIRKLQLDTTAADLADKIEVEHAPASVVLEISAEDGDRDQAAAIANAVADEMTLALDKLSPRSAATNTAAIRLTTLSRAAPANFPSSPNRNLSLAAGLMFGLLAGLAAVALRESIATPPLATRKDLARVTGLPLLAAIATDSRAGQRPIPVSTHPNIPRSHSIRILQTNLTGLKERGAIAVAVTSPNPGEGRTSIAVNLAIAMAHSGVRTLLVDADLQNHTVAQWLSLDNSVGLTSILARERSPEEGTQHWVTQLWGDRTVDVVTAGPRVANPTELLASPPMTDFLTYASDRYQAIVIDTPPLLQSTVGTVLAAKLDGALLVADSTRTKERHVTEALGRLRMAGANVLGVVLNRAGADSVGEYPASRVAKSRGGADAPRQHEAQHDVETSREAPAGTAFVTPSTPGSGLGAPQRRGGGGTATVLPGVPAPEAAKPRPAPAPEPAQAEPAQPDAAQPDAAQPDAAQPPPVVAFPGTDEPAARPAKRPFQVPSLPDAWSPVTPPSTPRSTPARADAPPEAAQPTAPIPKIRGEATSATAGPTESPDAADVADEPATEQPQDQPDGGDAGTPPGGTPPRAPERSEAISGGSGRDGS